MEPRDSTARVRYWLSIAAECEFRSGRLSRLILHPLDLGYRDAALGTRHGPSSHKGEAAQFVLERVRQLSDRFGAKLTIDGERAVLAIE